MTLNYPGYFINTSDLDFFYERWLSRHDINETTEITAANRKFSYALFYENYSFIYGSDYTTAFSVTFRETGNYTRSYEISYTKAGVRKFFQRESNFQGSTINCHFKEEMKLEKGLSETNSNFYSSLISILLVVLVVYFKKRRRKIS